MNTIKHLSWRVALRVCLLALLSGMASPAVWAEEAGESPAPSPAVVSESPAPSPVASPEPIVMTFPVAPAEPVAEVAPVSETTNSLVVPSETPVNNESASNQSEPTPLEIVVIQPSDPVIPVSGPADETSKETVGEVETLTPPATTTAPIVFDFAQESASAPATAVCGNNKLETGEQCDDGNLAEGDSCGATCQINAPANQEPVAGTILPEPKGQFIVAQWQMLAGQDNLWLGTDDSQELGAQILPSGQYQVNKNVVVCAVVADSESVANIKSVSATVSYPAQVAFNKADSGEKSGCGSLQSEFDLKLMEPDKANELLCNQIRNNNNNLPNWSNSLATNSAYDYERLCDKAGLLVEKNAQVYCAETSLAYNDPAGDYPVKIIVNKDLATKIEAESNLQYLELTTFDSDFTSVQYGAVDLNQLKVVAGDMIFGEGTAPSIRNTGNTRLRIRILQNDFNLGKTGEEWNVEYQAKLGAQNEYVKYWPEQMLILNNPLNLAQLINIDFGVLVKRYPEVGNGEAYAGKMTLSADKAPQLICQ